MKGLQGLRCALGAACELAFKPHAYPLGLRCAFSVPCSFVRSNEQRSTRLVGLRRKRLRRTTSNAREQARAHAYRELKLKLVFFVHRKQSLFALTNLRLRCERSAPIASNASGWLSRRGMLRLRWHRRPRKFLSEPTTDASKASSHLFALLRSLVSL